MKRKIKPTWMDYTEKGGGGSKKFQYILMGFIIALLILTKLLFASELTIDDVKNKVWRNPEKVYSWLIKNIMYVKDKVEYAQTAQETFDKRGGDCEDFAILAQYLLGNTYETYLVIWEGIDRNDNTNSCHCICVIKYHDALWVGIEGNTYSKTTLIGIVKESGNLNRTDIERAHFAIRDGQGTMEATKKIDLEDYYKVY